MGQTPPVPLLPTAEGDPAGRDAAWSARVWALRHHQDATQLRAHGFAPGRCVILLRAEAIPQGRSPLLFGEATTEATTKATTEATQATQRLLETFIGQAGQIVEVIQLDGVAHALTVRFPRPPHAGHADHMEGNVEVEVWADCVQPQQEEPPGDQTPTLQ